MFLASGSSSGILVAAGIIGAIFGTGGVAAFLTARGQNRKLDAETGVLQIDLVKGAVVVQADVIKDLREELNRQDAKIDEQARQMEAERKRQVELEEKCAQLQASYQELLTRFEVAQRERDSALARIQDSR